MFKKMLIPVDRSEFARATLDYALHMSETAACEVVVLLVVEPAIPTSAYVTPLGGYAEPYAALQDDANIYLKTVGDKLGSRPHQTLMRAGAPGEEIVECAKEVGADLIVMGTHGRSGLTRLLMGSTCEYVLRHATVPVLTLRAGWLLPEQPAVEHHAATALPSDPPARMTPL